MRGASRASLAAARERLETLLRRDGTDPAALAEELFAVTGTLADSPALRRALTDPSRDGSAKAGLVERLFIGKLSADAVDLVSGLVRDRWNGGGDLTETVEALAVTAVLSGAERTGRLEEVEDQLFRFSRIVAADNGLRDAFSTRSEGADRKETLVRRLLGHRAAPETVRLAVQAGTHPRGMRTERLLQSYVDAAAERRRQMVAEVTVASPLTEQQRERLTAALRRIYGRPVHLTVDVDPDVVGGIRVEIGGEVLDGTVAARLDEARRRLAG